jgi:hypothetical protein
MGPTVLSCFSLLAQQGGGGAYGAGQTAGTIFLVVLGCAILWKILKRK